MPHKKVLLHLHWLNKTRLKVFTYISVSENVYGTREIEMSGEI